jgi:hypothetical protein
MKSLEQRLKRIEAASASQEVQEFQFIAAFGSIEKNSICYCTPNYKQHKRISDVVMQELSPTPIRLSVIRVRISDDVISVRETARILVDVDEL